jgi:hypothetical protein
MVGALWGAAGSAVMLAFSSDRASSLEAELQRKAQVSRELNIQMQNVRNALEGFQTEEEKLVWPRVVRIRVVLLLIYSFAEGDG